MNTLTLRDRELVALGAALAANCVPCIEFRVPCIEFRVPAARKAGLTDEEIGEAIALADRIRQVLAGKVLDAAHGLLGAQTASAASCYAPAALPQGACC